MRPLFFILAFFALIPSVHAQVVLPATPPSCAAGEIGGVVFRDYDADGTIDAREEGIGGIVVTAYTDTAGVETTVGTDTSDFDGRWNITVADGTDIRLEFTSIPAYLESGVNGSDSSTTVRFETTSSQCDVNLGLANPGQHCGEAADDVDFSTTCYVPEDSVTGPHNAEPTIVTMQESDGSSSTTADTAYDGFPSSIAVAAETGSTWGIAYRRQTDDLFAGSLVKRHASLGPSGNPTTIYKIEPDGSSTTQWLTLDAGRADPHGVVANWQLDPNVYDDVAKEGLGDLEVSEDGNTLYTIDLGTRELVAIPIDAVGDPGTPVDFDIIANLPAGIVGAGAAQCPTTTDVRPFAIGINDGTVYIGAVCSAESTVNDAVDLPLTSANATRPGDHTKLRGYVFAYDGAALTTILDFPLNYDRGCAAWDQRITNIDSHPDPWDCDTDAGWDGDWAPWVDRFPFQSSALFRANMSYPTPILSDIEFDNGSMILGFTDRMAQQNANGTRHPEEDVYFEAYQGAGDLLRACLVDTNSWVMEEMISGDTRCGTAGESEGQGSLQTQFDEYYFEDDFFRGADPSRVYTTNGERNQWHSETALGGVLQIPGRSFTITNGYDPLRVFDTTNPGNLQPFASSFFDNGTMWFDNDAGSWLRSARLIDGIDPYSLDNFGKGSGLGDLVAHCPLPPLQIGNRIWLDEDGDGIQDATEPPIGSVTVTLTIGAQTATTTTDGNGNYLFADGVGDIAGWVNGEIPRGQSALITVDTLQAAVSSYNLTTADQGTDVRDSDATLNGTDAEISFTTGVSGANNHTFDMGFSQGASLGNRVWNDLDADGIQDAGEPNIPGVELALEVDSGGGVFVPAVDTSASPVPNQTTDASGLYNFENLPDGDYQVIVVGDNWTTGVFSATGSHNGFVPSPTTGVDNQDNTDDNGDNNGVANPSEVRSVTINIQAGTEPTLEDPQETVANNSSDLTIDFGFYGYNLGNRVFHDTNNSGHFDGTDTAIDGVTVELLDGAGAQIDSDPVTAGIQPTTDITAGGGLYLFEGLAAGDYIVRIDATNFAGAAVLDGFYPSTGANQEADPDTDGDENDNGLDSATFTADGILSDTITLGQPEPIGENPDNNTSLPDNRSNLTLDFGVFEPVSVGDYVWVDTNANGAQAGESGIAGATVEIFTSAGGAVTDVDGATVGSITTPGSGAYAFTNLVPGDYVIRVTPPAGYGPTPINTPDPDTTSDTDSNFDTTRTTPANTYESGVFTLTNNGETADGDADDNNNPSVDFGLVLSASIGNRVWNDLDADGIQDAGEPNIPGVELALEVDSGGGVFVPAVDIIGGAIGNVTTDANGLYNFSNLPDGDYQVIVVGTNWTTGVFSATGSHNGFVPTVGDGGDNQNNTDDNGNNDGVTNPPEVRSQTIDIASGGEPTLEDPQETVANNSSDLTVDFGFYGYNLGNQVFYDINNSGDRDGSEVGIDGVIVELLDASGNPIDSDPVTAGVQPTTDVTAAGGLYLFEGLAAGDYQVRVNSSNFAGLAVLDGYYPSTGSNQEVDPDTDGDNNDNGLDSTTFAADGILSDTITLGQPEPTGENPDNNTGLADNRSNLTLDFGVFEPVGVGDYVWLDADLDGDQAGESGIAGAIVEIFNDDGSAVTDVNGNAVGSQTTGGTGAYAFTNLVPGDYVIRVTPPAGYAPTGTNTPDPDTAGQTDSNFDLTRTPPTGTFESGIFTLANGEETADGDADDNNNPSVDFGLIPTLELGNYVWADANADGLQDGSENPIPGVTLRLELFSGGSYIPATDILGNPVPTETTDSSGNYLFDNLAEGTYRVVVDADNWTTGVFSDAGTHDDYVPTIGDGGDNQDNTDDNGNADQIDTAVGVVSQDIELRYGTEPTLEDPQETVANNSSDLTIDFGFTPRFDLAIIKTTSQTEPVNINDPVTFDVTVYNQGLVPADNINVIDYLPAQLTVNDPDWTDNGNGTANIILSVANGFLSAGGLAPGSSVTIEIDTIVSGAAFGDVINTVEIQAATDDNNQSRIDADSAPDGTNGNDPEVDDVIDNTGNDEDDADPARLTINGNIISCVEPVRIGNEIYRDRNCNGDEDDGEDGFDQIEVELRDQDDREVDSDKTDEDGDYELLVRQTGRYKIVVAKEDVDHLLQTEDPGSDVKLNNEVWVDVTSCDDHQGHYDFGFTETECELATTGDDVMCVSVGG